MDPSYTTNSTDHHHHHRRRDHRHPSFSSTLLDQIYNSIDDSSSHVSMTKKHNLSEKIFVNRRAVGKDSVRSTDLNTFEPVFFKHSDSSGFSSSNSDVSMRKKQNRVCVEKLLVNCRKTTVDSFRSTNLNTVEPVVIKHSSSSSDSSVFSSTNSDVSIRKKQNRVASLEENRVCVEKLLVNRRKTTVRSTNLKTVEPVYFQHSTSSSSSSDSSRFSSSESESLSPPPPICHPKPIRTTVEHRGSNNQEHGGFVRTKSRALKMYTDLKKAKQPISPGGRVAAFLNSIFTGTAKKPNKTKTATSSTTCSSASSFSRSSCLSKTTSSSEKSKRSVRFCPVNDVVHEEDSKREIRVMEENRRVIEAAKELIRTYHKNKDVDEDEDDAASCASSDLFELDNLSVIGINRYREELPVYETTRLNTNRVVSR